jgi:hypothetical protein
MPGQPKRPFQFSLSTAFVLLSVAAVGCVALSTLITDPALLVLAVLVLVLAGAWLLVILSIFGFLLSDFICLLARLLVAARPRIRRLMEQARRTSPRH